MAYSLFGLLDIFLGTIVIAFPPDVSSFTLATTFPLFVSASFRRRLGIVSASRMRRTKPYTQNPNELISVKIEFQDSESGTRKNSIRIKRKLEIRAAQGVGNF